MRDTDLDINAPQVLENKAVRTLRLSFSSRDPSDWPPLPPVLSDQLEFKPVYAVFGALGFEAPPGGQTYYVAGPMSPRRDELHKLGGSSNQLAFLLTMLAASIPARPALRNIQLWATGSVKKVHGFPVVGSVAYFNEKLRAFARLPAQAIFIVPKTNLDPRDYSPTEGYRLPLPEAEEEVPLSSDEVRSERLPCWTVEQLRRWAAQDAHEGLPEKVLILAHDVRELIDALFELPAPMLHTSQRRRTGPRVWHLALVATITVSGVLGYAQWRSSRSVKPNQQPVSPPTRALPDGCGLGATVDRFEPRPGLDYGPGVLASGAQVAEGCFPVEITQGRSSVTLKGEGLKGIGLNLLVLRFADVGPDAAARQLGDQVGRRMWAALEHYKIEQSRSQGWQQVHLSAEGLQIKYSNACQAASHDDARRIGKAWGADLVLWGQVTSDSNSTDKRAHKESLTPFITAVRWPALQLVARHGALYDSDLIQQLDFPELVSDEPLALLHFMLGVYAHRNHRYGLATRYFEKAEAEQFLTSAVGANKLHLFLGESYIADGQIERGTKFLEEGRANCRTDLSCLALSSMSLSSTYRYLEDYERSLKFAQEALAHTQKISDEYLRMEALIWVGLGFYDRKDNKNALDSFKQAFCIADKYHELNNWLASVHGIAMVKNAMGDNRGALEQYSKELDLVRQLGDLDSEAGILENIAHAHSSIGIKLDNKAEIKIAADFYKQALTILEEMGDNLGQAQITSAIALHEELLGNREEAMRYYERTLHLWKGVHVRHASSVVNSFFNFWNFYHRSENRAKAQQGYDELIQYANKIENAEDSARILFNSAVLYDKVDAYSESLGLFKRAAALLEKLPGHQHLPDALRGQASTLSALDRVSDAINAYRQAATLYYQQSNLPMATKTIISAFDLAQRRALLVDCRRLLSDVRRFDLGTLPALALEARRLNLTGQSPEAAYRRLADLANQADSERRWTYVASAGLERLHRGGKFEGCLGLVVTGLPKTDREHPSGLSIGDILLRHQGACLDMIEQKRKLLRSDANDLRICRKDKCFEIQVTSPMDDVELFSF